MEDKENLEYEEYLLSDGIDTKQDCNKIIFLFF
jgi:hypothetical protein